MYPQQNNLGTTLKVKGWMEIYIFSYREQLCLDFFFKFKHKMSILKSSQIKYNASVRVIKHI